MLKIGFSRSLVQYGFLMQNDTNKVCRAPRRHYFEKYDAFSRQVCLCRLVSSVSVNVIGCQGRLRNYLETVSGVHA